MQGDYELCNRIPEINLIGTFEEPSKVLSKLPSMEIDLILLDMEMPNRTGLEFLEQLPYQPDTYLRPATPNLPIMLVNIK